MSDIPNRIHLLQLDAIRQQLYSYRHSRSDRVPLIASGCECKLLIPAFDSERHPDVSLYLTAPPPINDASLWHYWFPEIVIEVVSPESRKCDYEEKPEEYLRFGLMELSFRRWRRQFPAIFRGWLAGRGSQVPRTRSHRLTHQPDGPLAAMHRAPDPGMPRRCVGPRAATDASSPLRLPDCQRPRFRR